MTTDATSVDALLDAVEAADADAIAQHKASTCHLSEWSCSHCEADGCSHDWLLRPELDTWQCLICGSER